MSELVELRVKLPCEHGEYDSHYAYIGEGERNSQYEECSGGAVVLARQVDWCSTHGERWWDEKGCSIYAAALAFNANEAEYPAEWISEDMRRGLCTAFEQEDFCSADRIPEVHTVDRFVEWVDMELNDWQRGYVQAFFDPATSFMMLDLAASRDPIHEEIRRFIQTVRG